MKRFADSECEEECPERKRSKNGCPTMSLTDFLHACDCQPWMIHTKGVEERVWRERLKANLGEFGVAVLPLLDEETCLETYTSILDELGCAHGREGVGKRTLAFNEFVTERILAGVDGPTLAAEVQEQFPEEGSCLDSRKRREWIPGPRLEMYRTVASHLPSVWKLRLLPNIVDTVRSAYQAVRPEGSISKDPPFACSKDGAALFSPLPDPRFPKHVCERMTRPWVHVDQVQERKHVHCLQGSIALTHTRSGFMAMPGAHRVHGDLMDEMARKLGKERKKMGDFLMLGKSPDEVQWLEEFTGTKLQPILAPAGSLVLWDSRLPHCNRPSDKLLVPDHNTSRHGKHLLNARAACYLCYRPLSELTTLNRKTAKRSLEELRATNHGSNRLFALRDCPHPSAFHVCCESAKEITQNPRIAFERLGFDPKEHPDIVSLAGV